MTTPTFTTDAELLSAGWCDDFVAFLNEHGAEPDLARGQITGFLFPVVFTSENGAQRTIPTHVGLGPHLEGWLDEHEAGADRGGYVPTLFAKLSCEQIATYDVVNCVWEVS